MQSSRVAQTAWFARAVELIAQGEPWPSKINMVQFALLGIRNVLSEAAMPRFLLALAILMKAVAVAFTLCLMMPLTAAQAAQQVSCQTSGATTKCRISEPVVTQRFTTYPQIQFAPNDQVTVAAGGCVQTGGHGKTWKRYVDPRGPNSERLYHGLIQIPGVQSDLVHVQGVVGRTFTIPSGLPPTGNALRLGYEDDGYGDNGYWGHDDGTGDQCKNVGNAFVELTIVHGAGGSGIHTAAAPFDFVFTQTDANAFPLNGQWAWQRDHGVLPNADTQCFNLPGNFSNQACTSQSPSIDTPDYWNAAWCAVGAKHSIHGHVNWMPAAVQGTITWVSHSSPGTDDDYNINITTPGLEGQTVDNGGQIEGEFDSDETIDHFHTPWWENFHHAVDSSDGAAHGMIDGKPTIMIGLVGLDCEHGCATELHPVYAMAIHVNDDPNDDTWAIFARNWGNEGYCSRYQHLLDVNQMSFMIPQPAATAVSVNVASSFLTNNASVSGPAVTLVPGKGALVSFGLPNPEQHARLNGELHLKWTLGTGNPRARWLDQINRQRLRSRVSPAALAETQDVHGEQRVNGLIAALPGPAKAQLNASLLSAPAFDATVVHGTPPRSPAPSSMPRVRTQIDAVKAQKDRARADAICAAYASDPAGRPSQCTVVVH